MGAFVSCFRFNSERLRLRASHVAGAGLTAGGNAKDGRHDLQVDFSPLPAIPSILGSHCCRVAWDSDLGIRRLFTSSRSAYPEQPLLGTISVSQPCKHLVTYKHLKCNFRTLRNLPSSPPTLLHLPPQIVPWGPGPPPTDLEAFAAGQNTLLQGSYVRSAFQV